jgi:hypothetical protein
MGTVTNNRIVTSGPRNPDTVTPDITTALLYLVDNSGRKPLQHKPARRVNAEYLVNLIVALATLAALQVFQR